MRQNLDKLSDPVEIDLENCTTGRQHVTLSRKRVQLTRQGTTCDRLLANGPIRYGGLRGVVVNELEMRSLK